MITLFQLRDASMARRFALAAAGLAAGAVLLISLASWWLINREHQHLVDQLNTTEREFRAAAVGTDLSALASRMAEMAESTILATGLVDSAGRETYLAPFLAGIRQINGVPVQVLFTDFEGQEIASNGMARFSSEQLKWLRGELAIGNANARVFESPQSQELVALAPMRYARTSTPEGALFYKVALADLQVGETMALEWGTPVAGGPDDGEPVPAATVPVPAVFEPLQLRVRARGEPQIAFAEVAPQYLAILLFAVILFAAVVVLGTKLARVMTRDLERLQLFSSRFVGSGLSSERAPVGGSEEVASLALSINAMLDRLNEQHTTLSLEQEKLSRMADVLRVADRRKDDFLAMLAHELRNPLAPIAAGAEVLKRIPGSDSQVLRTSAIIARQARHMTDILDDLLDVSRVTRGRITLERSELDFTEIVRMAVEQVRPLVDQHGHSLVIEMPPAPLPVFGDRARLIQMLSNLLTNSAKYTAAGGRIALTVHDRADMICTVVQDNGSGIAPELMPEIFDLFSQGTRAVDRAHGGLGLGLALVKHLVGLHGGSIVAASDGPGQGAAFTVCLPRYTAGAAVSAAPAAVGAPAADGGLRLMLVDDNVDAALSMAELLEMDGHSVRVAHDGAAALAQLDDDGAVDAFLLDIGLPGMDGFDLARELRSRPGTRDALLIAITGYGQVSDRANSTMAGFDQHLVKPVDPATLQKALASVRARAQAAPDHTPR